MKPTVITTGPGVIIATATASTNCLSVSQWFSVTTPPYRNGTIAKPEPNTKAPALAKKTPIWVSSDQSWLATTAEAVGSCIAATALMPPLGNHLGGARQNHTTRPAAINSQAISDSVITVTAANTR